MGEAAPPCTHRVAKPGAQPRPAAEAKGDRGLQPNRKLTYKDQRDLDRLPGEIDRIEESEIAATEAALHDPQLYSREPGRLGG